ncbi:hypothetical protein OSB04_021115 [Centaurea solstitialis]|uniref:Uncharacterized protein n=1 Tax=Centaurea solstitialis TaxID=347529 RepID=A0AA38W4L3_9ASTR|nr:hypothetical protein OSB04_021115 [Centaurea solstitialis]
MKFKDQKTLLLSKSGDDDDEWNVSSPMTKKGVYAAISYMACAGVECLQSVNKDKLGNTMSYDHLEGFGMPLGSSATELQKGRGRRWKRKSKSLAGDLTKSLTGDGGVWSVTYSFRSNIPQLKSNSIHLEF